MVDGYTANTVMAMLGGDSALIDVIIVRACVSCVNDCVRERT